MWRRIFDGFFLLSIFLNQVLEFSLDVISGLIEIALLPESALLHPRVEECGSPCGLVGLVLVEPRTDTTHKLSLIHI